MISLGFSEQAVWAAVHEDCLRMWMSVAVAASTPGMMHKRQNSAQAYRLMFGLFEQVC